MRLLTGLLIVTLQLLVSCGGDGDAETAATADPGAAQPQSAGDGAIFIRSLGIGAPLTLKHLVAGEQPPSPDGADDVAIYDFGPDLAGMGGEPGKGGNVVLSGLSIALEGCAAAEPPCDGVFRRLSRVEPGAEVDLLWQSQTYKYQVISICFVPASEFGDGLYRRTTEERLTMLTGAGNWSSEQGWSHVLIVIAKPAPRTALEPCPSGTAEWGS